jgi:hypothetical protein
VVGRIGKDVAVIGAGPELREDTAKWAAIINELNIHLD